ncbi:MAG: thiopurine S-methyltransferase [Symploca sp. SIO2E6]|nr:thiopurine S-methyltransferase [Symploca sp. SIO2E6]
MDASFWLQKWQNNDIGFHKSEANPVLVKYFPELKKVKDNRVFVPLCGKTLDIAWLLAHGYRVVGAELIEMAIEQLFTELGVEPTISGIGDIKHYSAKKIDIFVGDIFDLSGEMLGRVDAIYDRAALVALPEAMRDRYTVHLREITEQAPQLLVTFEYDQNLMTGPPFSISNEEVNRHYRDSYDLTLLASTDIPGGFKGKYAAEQHVWLLQND